MAELTKRQITILEALAHELETHPGGRITTAALAKSVGVSEGALYRHFPSKARMFEGLISFAEETVFTRINQILSEETEARIRCAKILYLMLGFADRNPGITRILLGDALIGERESLRRRTQQFFDRLTTQIKQVLRETDLRGDSGLKVTAEAAASTLTAFAEGRLQQFQRSGFNESPINSWESDWQILEMGIFQ